MQLKLISINVNATICAAIKHVTGNATGSQYFHDQDLNIKPVHSLKVTTQFRGSLRV